MPFDSSAFEQPAPKVDLWRLPAVLSVKAKLVEYERPKVRYMGTKREEYRRALEIMVETAEPIPARALSPALYVGSVEIPDYEMAGKNLYRFFAFDPDLVRDDAEVRLEWPKRRSPAGSSPIRLKLAK